MLLGKQVSCRSWAKRLRKDRGWVIRYSLMTSFTMVHCNRKHFLKQFVEPLRRHQKLVYFCRINTLFIWVMNRCCSRDQRPKTLRKKYCTLSLCFCWLEEDWLSIRFMRKYIQFICKTILRVLWDHQWVPMRQLRNNNSYIYIYNGVDFFIKG